MKDPSIKEKEKAKLYDETIERAKKVLLDCTPEERKVVEYIYPGLAEDKEEDKDERIRKELIEYFEWNAQILDNFDNKDVIAWLEKQGEQKPTDTPKFRVGDWVVSPNGVYWHIDAIRNDRYQVSSNLGNIADWPLNTNIYHKFTIQDAKDGDVLCIHSSESYFDCVFLYQNTYEIEPNRNVAAAYCCIDVHANKIEFGIQGPDCIDVRKIKPATQEQRVHLFQKMKEAGYEWDAKDKVLKKIEQKPQTELPKGEDYAIDGLWQAIQILEHSLGEVDGWQSDDGILEHKCAIEAVKRLYEQKATWSEEDEYILKNICDLVQENKIIPNRRQCVEECLTWLNSLKGRITPTNKNDFDRGYEVGISAAQFNQWKPTEEQLEALEWSLGDYRNVIFEERHDTLTSLYNDLKKLKGEK